jgi:hypothetical protein
LLLYLIDVYYLILFNSSSIPSKFVITVHFALHITHIESLKAKA